MKKFLFSVNVCVFITMMLFMVKFFLKVVKNRYTGEWMIIYMHYYNEKVFI